MSKLKKSFRNPWAWVPSLYYAEGIPYVIVMLVSVAFYKRMGISNTEIALYTSWLYLPWVIKPFWAPFIDFFRTKRIWIVVMQLFIGAGLAAVALTMPSPDFLKYTLIFFFLLAFSSATHDIAADGFYMLGLSEGDQSLYVGIRSTFYRLSMITGQGLLIILAGYFETHSGLPPVNVTINSSNSVRTEQIIDTREITANSDDLLVISNTDQLNISTDKISKAKADSILSFVSSSNIKNGFYERDPKQAEIVPAKKGEMTANIGVVFFKLTKEPVDKNEVVVYFDRESGDKSISLIEGSRIVFNRQNWNRPAYAVFQLDPKLRTETTAAFKATAGDIPWAWSMTFLILTGLFIVFFIYHAFILPYPVSDKPAVKDATKNIAGDFIRTFALFFKKKHILLILTFLLIYRFGEAQLVKMATPFLLDPKEVGGLGLTLGQYGLVYGTVGIIALTLGGILGGIVAARHGLKKWLWWMFAAINIPHILYIYLAYAQPDNLLIINLCVAGEQFGYGFGFTAYMLYMIYVSEGEFKTSHYALCTGFMALSMMIPGMFAGWIQEQLGYPHFFVWILLTMIPGFIITKLIPLDPAFGKKQITAKPH